MKLKTSKNKASFHFQYSILLLCFVFKRNSILKKSGKVDDSANNVQTAR